MRRRAHAPASPLPAPSKLCGHISSAAHAFEPRVVRVRFGAEDSALTVDAWHEKVAFGPVD
jgi:hypothetical protein